MGSRSLRFGFQLVSGDSTDLVSGAVEAEKLGFDAAVVADHIGSVPAPMPTLGAIAAVTKRIRLGTMVLNNDMRNPVQVAAEAVALDHLSGGRFELGLGAGHTPQEYAGTGITMSEPLVRKQRLAESVEIVRRLLDGGKVDFTGVHYALEGAETGPAAQDHLPILIGGNGDRLLRQAGTHADIVGLQGLGRTTSDGHRHLVKWSADRLTQQIEQIRLGAGDRYDDVELSALVQHVEITDDRESVLESLCERIEGLAMQDALATPYLMVGTTAEIINHIHECNRRWGISYFVVRDQAFATVISSLGSCP